MTDMVNSPPHYQHLAPSSQYEFVKANGVETIDAIEACMSPKEFQAYCRGNAMKYLSRCQHKGTYHRDLLKAQWYLKRCLASVEAEEHT